MGQTLVRSTLAAAILVGTRVAIPAADAGADVNRRVLELFGVMLGSVALYWGLNALDTACGWGMSRSWIAWAVLIAVNVTAILVAILRVVRR